MYTANILRPKMCPLQCVYNSEKCPQPPLSPSGLEFHTLRVSWDAPSAPLDQLAQDQQSHHFKTGLLHHCQGDPVRCHRPRLDRDPQVLSIGRILFLFRFWPCRCHGVSAGAATAAVGMATAAAVAAHHQSSEEDKQGESQEDHQADGVVHPLVVLFCCETPKLIEKVLDAFCLLLHGFQIRRCSSL